jgi:hypothetical protein
MAGANNAQLKRAGYKAKDVRILRAKHNGKPISIAAVRADGATPRQPPPGWKAAAEGRGPGAQRLAQEALSDYLTGTRRPGCGSQPPTPPPWP